MSSKTFRGLPPHRHLLEDIIGGGTIEPGNPYNQFPTGNWDFEGLFQIVAEATSMTQTQIVDATTKWITELLTGTASSGQKIVDVADGSSFSADEIVVIRDDDVYETNTIASINVNQLTMENNLSNTYTTAANGAVDHWEPEGFTEPDNKLRWKDITTLNHISSFLVSVSDDNDNPLLVVDQGVIVKKDLFVGGFLGAGQGALILKHGLIHANDPPKIVLSDSGDGFDTLHITTVDQLTEAKVHAVMPKSSTWVLRNNASTYEAFSGINNGVYYYGATVEDVIQDLVDGM